MSGRKAQRGRPKGTGLDDRARLEAIAALIAANPQLKPTTAIRSLGVTDPSTIRRLRDKFHAARDTLMKDRPNERRSLPPPAADIMHAGAAGERSPSSGGAGAVQSHAPVMAIGTRPARRTPRVRDKRGKRQAPAALNMAVHEPVHKGLKSADVIACWWGVGLSMANATLDAQFALFQQLMGLPQVGIAVDHQLALGEFAIATCAPHTRRRTLLH